jgi:cell division protein FtsQ
VTDVLEKPRIDPRIAQRWIDARREEGRRRLKILAVSGGVVAMGAMAFGSLFTPIFQVRHVRASVQGGLDPARAVQLAGLAHHPLMIDVNPGAVARRLDTDPWLGAARVLRKWPDSIVLSVAVRTPTAVVPVGPRSWAEIDSTGRVVADTALPPSGLPIIDGVGSPPAPGQWMAGSLGPRVDPRQPIGQAVDMAAASDASDVPRGVSAAVAIVADLPQPLQADVTTVTIGASGTLSLAIAPPRMAAGIVQVTFGDGSQLQSKVVALLTILDQANLSGVKTIDVSVPGRPAALTARS